MKVFVLLALLGLVAAQTFQGQVVMRNDPNVVGTITANVFYSQPANRTRFDYTNIGGGIQEFFEFSALVSVRYLVCPGTCQAETIKTPILRLFREGNEVAAGTVQVTDLAGAVKTCNRFNKVNPPSGGITQIAFDSNNNICQARFANGKQWDFFNVVGLQGNPFNARPANCPQPQCTKRQDIMLVFDESGSIDATSFQREKQFGIDFANTFTFSPNNVGMGLVQFDTDARLTILLTFDRSSFVNQMNQISQRRRATCIGCGIQRGQQELQSARGRSTATKTMVVLTDGQNNVNVAQFPGILSTAKNAGITMVAIGVANAVASEINTIASAPNLAFFATDFSRLNTILDGLAVQTCDDILGNPCGAGCKGFCACNQQCLCPDVCENQDKCVQPFCNVNQNGAGCQFPRNVVCNDNNACTIDSCNSQLGCVTAPVVCNDGKKCTSDSCDPSVGCVFLSVDCTPNPPDPCNNFSCSETGPGNGCVSIPNPCDLCLVNNVQCPKINCKINVCNPANGQCRATDKVCNSNNKCIIDSCDPATDNCVQTPVVCNDNNACTDDSCNPATGCVFTPFDPAVRCDDSSVCTTDTCVPATGCVNTPITCNRTSICKDAVCNSVLGCQESDVDCGAVLSQIDPNKQGNCYVAACDANRPNQANQGRDGCFLSQLPGTSVDRCGFCAAPGSQSPFCFLGLDAGSAAGLGGGVIAAIVIGAVVAAVVAVVSGKKGYDVWVKHRNNMQGAQANPMYEDSGRSGNNPFFEARS